MVSFDRKIFDSTLRGRMENFSILILVEAGESGIDVDGILQKYCAAIYAKHRSNQAVA